MGLQGQLNKELEKAKASGRFMVMISYVDRATEILHHNTITNDFKVGDFDACILEHSKHLNDQRAKAGKGVSRGTFSSEEDKEDNAA